MTLREAVSEIRTRTTKKDLDLLVRIAQLEDKGDSIDDVLYKQVIRMVRNHVRSNRPESEALLVRLEAELAAYMRD